MFFLISVAPSCLQFAAVSKEEFNQMGIIHSNGLKEHFPFQKFCNVISVCFANAFPLVLEFYPKRGELSQFFAATWREIVEDLHVCTHRHTSVSKGIKVHFINSLGLVVQTFQ